MFMSEYQPLHKETVDQRTIDCGRVRISLPADRDRLLCEPSDEPILRFQSYPAKDHPLQSGLTELSYEYLHPLEPNAPHSRATARYEGNLDTSRLYDRLHEVLPNTIFTHIMECTTENGVIVLTHADIGCIAVDLSWSDRVCIATITSTASAHGVHAVDELTQASAAVWGNVTDTFLQLERSNLTLDLIFEPVHSITDEEMLLAQHLFAIDTYADDPRYNPDGASRPSVHPLAYQELYRLTANIPVETLREALPPLMREITAHKYHYYAHSADVDEAIPMIHCFDLELALGSLRYRPKHCQD